MTDENLLLDLCDYIVKKGKEFGATAIEAQATSISELDAQIELAQVSGVNRKMVDEISIRLYVGSKMGSAFLTSPTKEAAEDAIKMAMAAAKVTTEDPDWTDIPHPATYRDIPELWNESVESSDPSEIVKTTNELITNSIQALEGLIPAFGGSGATSYHSAYCNSNGVSVSERETIAYAFLGAVAQTRSGMTPMVMSYDIRRDLNLNLEGIIDEAASLLKFCKSQVEGKSGKYTVVMSPHAYSQLMNFTLIQSLRGDNVARGKSRIGDRIGESIASDVINIYDDGTHPKGLFTSKADDEGVPRQKTPLIENGILRSFLWDTYWANKMGVKSTGNARRNKRQGLVEISPTTIVVEYGKRSISNILSEIEFGYYVRNVQGAHSSNPESGDFSVVGNPAILIQNGEMMGSIPGLMVAGNIFNLLKNVREVAREQSFLMGLIGPDIVFDDIDIIVK